MIPFAAFFDRYRATTVTLYRLTKDARLLLQCPACGAKGCAPEKAFTLHRGRLSTRPGRYIACPRPNCGWAVTVNAGLTSEYNAPDRAQAPHHGRKGKRGPRP